MAKAVIALGSNLGDRLTHFRHARRFLSGLSTQPVVASSIYETEPVGEASTHMYYNAVCCIDTRLDAMSLLEAMKDYERDYGRDPSAPRWSNRTIDLDIIDYGRQVIEQQRIRVPHPQYARRLFVLIPLQEILPDWKDARSGLPIDRMIADSPKIQVLKTGVNW